MKLMLNPRHVPGSVVALGMFDGVHLGHQALLKKGRELAGHLFYDLSVCTFEPHPTAVLCPERAPRRLTTPGERALLMARAGVRYLCVHTFTRELAALEPEVFLDRLMEIYDPGVVVCGFNFTFGARGRGSSEMLMDWGQRHRVQVEVIPAVTVDGDTVSSTRVRALLAAGQCEGAAALLGRPYAISGTAVECAEGSRLKASWHKALPGPGRYACEALFGGKTQPVLAEIRPGEEEIAVPLRLPRGERVRLRFLHGEERN